MDLSFKEDQRVEEKTHFSPIPLFWTGLRVINMGMVCYNKGIFSN